MSTAVAPTQTSTTTDTTTGERWWYGRQDRAKAARRGWLRRKGLYVPTEWERFALAIKAADPCALRLYVCDVAEAAQHHYLARFPGDWRTLAAISEARRYARGEATEQERILAGRMMTYLCRGLPHERHWREPYYAAAESAGFCTAKRLDWVAEWGLYYAGVADQRDEEHEASRIRHVAALEALARHE